MKKLLLAALIAILPIAPAQAENQCDFVRSFAEKVMDYRQKDFDAATVTQYLVKDSHDKNRDPAFISFQVNLINSAFSQPLETDVNMKKARAIIFGEEIYGFCQKASR